MVNAAFTPRSGRLPEADKQGCKGNANPEEEAETDDQAEGNQCRRHANGSFGASAALACRTCTMAARRERTVAGTSTKPWCHSRTIETRSSLLLGEPQHFKEDQEQANRRSKVDDDPMDHRQALFDLQISSTTSMTILSGDQNQTGKNNPSQQKLNHFSGPEDRLVQQIAPQHVDEGESGHDRER